MTFIPGDIDASAGTARNNRSGVVIVKNRDGRLGWRAVEAGDRAITPLFGKVMGQGGDHAVQAKYDLSRKVIENALRSMFSGNAVEQGSARSKRTQAAKRKALAVARSRKRRRTVLSGAAPQD